MATKDIQNIINDIGNFTDHNIITETNEKLIDATSGYSAEVLKLAISQTTLEEEQIRAILSSKGYRDALLETTTAELAQVTATNALSASEAAASGTTGGLSVAFEGLAASLGISTAALGALMAAAAGITVVAAAVNIYKKC